MASPVADAEQITHAADVDTAPLIRHSITAACLFIIPRHGHASLPDRAASIPLTLLVGKAGNIRADAYDHTSHV